METLEVKTTMPFTFTAQAIEELERIKSSNPDAADQVLRVGVKGGGCSGLSYLLAFDQATEKDKLYHLTDNITVALEKAHEMYVVGMEIQFAEGLNSRGFTFVNPNAKSTCGCGTSFSV